MTMTAAESARWLLANYFPEDENPPTELSFSESSATEFSNAVHEVCRHVLAARPTPAAPDAMVAGLRAMVEWSPNGPDAALLPPASTEDVT